MTAVMLLRQSLHWAKPHRQCYFQAITWNPQHTCRFSPDRQADDRQELLAGVMCHHCVLVSKVLGVDATFLSRRGLNAENSKRRKEKAIMAANINFVYSDFAGALLWEAWSFSKRTDTSPRCGCYLPRNSSQVLYQTLHGNGPGNPYGI